MPGQFRISVDRLAEELQQVHDLGIPAVMLFGIPDEELKDSVGTPAYAEEGIICRALGEAKQQVPDLLLIADVCLCEYTDHGHCGLISQTPGEAPGVDNDRTLEVLAPNRPCLCQGGCRCDCSLGHDGRPCGSDPPVSGCGGGSIGFLSSLMLPSTPRRTTDPFEKRPNRLPSSEIERATRWIPQTPERP